MRQHADGRNIALVEAVTEHPTQKHARHLEAQHQRVEKRSLGHGITEAFLDMRNGVDIDCHHREQRKTVTERNHPERAGAQRFARGETLLVMRRGFGLADLQWHRRQPIHRQAQVFRPAANDARQRPAHQNENDP